MQIAPSKKEQRQQAADMRKKSQPLTQKINKLEKELDKLQSREVEITTQLAEPTIYEASNKDKLTELLKEKGTVENQIEEVEMAWFEINEELELLQQQLASS